MPKTPYGEICITKESLPEDLISLICDQARGCWQKEVVHHLLKYGYVVGYMPTGSPIRGKAGNWKSHYDRSLRNLICRINDVLKGTAILYVESGPTGTKGGWGYYLRG